MSDTKEPCPTCDRGLWHVGHECYTYADLAALRASVAADWAETVAVIEGRVAGDV